jgi:hypothetical protein
MDSPVQISVLDKALHDISDTRLVKSVACPKRLRVQIVYQKAVTNSLLICPVGLNQSSATRGKQPVPVTSFIRPTLNNHCYVQALGFSSQPYY